MSTYPLAFHRTGLVTAVGLEAASACAAMRCKLTNPSETRFIDSRGEWIMAHQVPLEQPWLGRAKLAKMAAMAIREALSDVPAVDWPNIPLLLCVAEKERPGRTDGLDDTLPRDIERELGQCFDARSAVVPHGRVAVAVALSQARALIYQQRVPYVLIAAADSLLSWPTLSHYDQRRRLLTATNSNGFLPGEGAGALLVGQPSGSSFELHCQGLGFAVEDAHIDSEEPLRAEGLTQAVKHALAEAGCEMHDIDYRITDLSGEQYYFKEAALALARTLRRRKEEFDLWHPAECTGEAGALAGAAVIALADAAGRKGYTRGPAILAHMANDGGQRAALALHFRST
ncbi:3-oxoacyl-ACP synthase [Caldimonas brevitalea]|uniref:3-oxoacyl-ACP synthase n=1 Tax=Caldimonas brevitalea TaxID=413882 RepID=A0A0G3BNX5_9BURK|nr:3-oxoacyl-ACP synthase [Caldimonas brevitalea]AKJ29688.1 3-oxoacyl-ACP synthase [Caldimonas brevitalea]